MFVSLKKCILNHILFTHTLAFFNSFQHVVFPQLTIAIQTVGLQLHTDLRSRFGEAKGSVISVKRPL